MEYSEIIMIGVPRTGTGSMNHALSVAGIKLASFPNGRNEIASKARLHVGEDRWKESFKFAFTRHPIDRFISAWATCKGINRIDDLHIYNPTLFIPQSTFIDEKLDFIGRFENMEEDWKKLNDLIGIDAELPHFNQRPTEGPYHYDKKELTDVEEKYVREYYAEDFKRFKYD